MSCYWMLYHRISVSLNFAHCRNIKVGTNKRVISNSRENCDSKTSSLLLSQNVLHLMHFTNCQFGSRSLSKCTLWSDRQLAAISSVTKQAQSTVYNSTDCNAKQTAGNCKWLHIDRLFPAVTAIWHTYQELYDWLAA